MESGRFLTPDEVDLLLDFTVSAESYWNIMIVSADSVFENEIKELFSDDNRVRITVYGNGCTALIAIARNIPDLIIIDDMNIKDIASSEIIKTIKSDVVLADTRVVCRIRNYSEDMFPDWGANDYIASSGVDIDKIYITRKMQAQLYNSNNRKEETLNSSHERFWPRTRLNIKATLTVVDPNNPEGVHHGVAIVENISLGGALLSDIKLAQGALPSGSVIMNLHIDQADLKGLTAESLVVHCNSEGKTGVKFLALSRENRSKITDLFMK